MFARSSPDGLFEVRRFAYKPILLVENKLLKTALVDAMFQVAVTVGLRTDGHEGDGDVPHSAKTTGPVSAAMLESKWI